MNNKHQELIAEKVAEVCNKIKLDYLLKADSLLRGMCLDKELRIVLTKTLQDTIDTALEGERESIKLDSNDMQKEGNQAYTSLVEGIEEVRKLMPSDHKNIDERISFYAACNEMETRIKTLYGKK
jgi:hypothetical protein